MLRIKTLGGWSVTRGDGSPREIPAQRVALLAVLCAAGDRGISRDRAVALLWPDRPDENARHSLGQSLYALRRDAESPEVVLGTTTLALNPAVVSCDAWELDAALRAGDLGHVLALYDGPFLSGVHLRGSADLQHIMDAESARLAKLYGDAVESLARGATARGHAGDAAALWRTLAAENPYSSRVALELVRALTAAGDRVAALQSARVHEALVREEMEVEPDPEFCRFVSELRRDAVQPMPGPLADAGDAMDKMTTAEPPAVRAPAVETPPGDVLTLRSATPNGDVGPSRTGGTPSKAWRAGAAAAACIVLLVGATRYFRSPADLDPRRVYVAWFENRTGDRTLDQIGGMAGDWVSQGLEQSGVVAVASAARAAWADGGARESDGATAPAADPARQASAFGAGTIVSGAYYKIGGRLRFHVQIGDVARGEVLDAFDAVGGTPADPTTAMDAVRQRAMGSLASLVDPRLSSWVRVASRPPSYQAYREFVTGQSVWGIDYRQALTHFLNAAALDSTFYAARVEAAILHRLLNQCARTEAIAAELSAVRDRLAPYDYHVLDEQVAQCHGDWERSYREARAVADLRPRSAFLEYSVALQAMQLGRYGEAHELLAHHTVERGVAEVGPNYAIVYAQVLATAGDGVKAREVTQWLRGRYPTFAGGWGTEAVLLARDGRVQDAERLIDTMTTLPLVPTSVVAFGMRRTAAALAARGETAGVQRVLTRTLAFMEREARGRPDPQRDAERAQLLYELGRLDEARAMLASLVAADSSNVDLRGYVGMVAARCGDDSIARDVDVWLATARTPYTFTRTLYRVRIAALMDDRERALALLGNALDESGRFMLPAIREYDELASLRRDGRFERLVTLR